MTVEFWGIFTAPNRKNGYDSLALNEDQTPTINNFLFFHLIIDHCSLENDTTTKICEYEINEIRSLDLSYNKAKQKHHETW